MDKKFEVEESCYTTGIYLNALIEALDNEQKRVDKKIKSLANTSLVYYDSFKQVEDELNKLHERIEMLENKNGKKA